MLDFVGDDARIECEKADLGRGSFDRRGIADGLGVKDTESSSIVCSRALVKFPEASPVQ